MALLRLLTLWLPIAAALSLALWSVLLDPWGRRAHWPWMPHGVPSQLLLALVLVVAGRFETAAGRSGGSGPPARIYWAATAFLVILGVVALGLLPSFSFGGLSRARRLGQQVLRGDLPPPATAVVMR